MHLWHNNVIERGKFLIRQLEMDRARLTVSQVGSLATGASGQSPGDTSGQPNADACDGRFDVAFCSDRGIRGVDNRWVGQTF
jgi:hypothetical protein